MVFQGIGSVLVAKTLGRSPSLMLTVRARDPAINSGPYRRGPTSLPMVWLDDYTRRSARNRASSWQGRADVVHQLARTALPVSSLHDLAPGKAGSDVRVVVEKRAPGSTARARRDYSVGRVKVNVEPCARALSTSIVPPCISTSCLAMARPKPVPPLAREREASPLQKRSKT